MDWKEHAGAYYATWPLRYLEPGEAAWKTFLDDFLLFDKKGKKQLYPEGRSIILQKLSTQEKSKMISNLPKKATYIKECLRRFWKLKLEPLEHSLDGYSAESPWHGHRFRIHGVTNKQRAYCKHVLKVTQMSDIMDRNTNRPFTTRDWRKFVERLHKEYYGVEPTNEDIIDYAEIMKKITDAQSNEQKKHLMSTWRPGSSVSYHAHITVGAEVYLVRESVCWAAIIEDNTWARRIFVDAVGRGHWTSRKFEHRFFDVITARKWNGKWAGPAGGVYACDVTWNYYGIRKLEDLTIHSIVKRKADHTMKPPKAQDRWNERLQPRPMNRSETEINWEATWKLKAKYVTPRDKTQIMRLQRRNLWVAQHGGCGHTTCACTGCNEPESQLHLTTCPVIKRDFWEKVKDYGNELGLTIENNSIFLITGQTESGEEADKEDWALATIAWRSLYAETTKAHLEETQLDLQQAVFKTARLLNSRVIAYGHRWHTWFYHQEFHARGCNMFPPKYSDFKLIKFEPDGRYRVNGDLARLLKAARNRTRTSDNDRAQTRPDREYKKGQRRTGGIGGLNRRLSADLAPQRLQRCQPLAGERPPRTP